MAFMPRVPRGRDAGMALVLEGVTSLDELQRVFAVAGAAPAAARKGIAKK